MEWDTGSTDDDDRVLHTTDVSSQSPSAPVDHLSKKKRLKQKAKVLLHVSPKHSENVESVDPVTLAPTPKAAAMPYRLGTDPPMEGLDGLKDFCHQPVETIKAKAGRRSNRDLAANLVTQEVTHAHNVELVHAQDHLASAKTEKERLSACSDLEALKKARQDMFVRWTMDRHVSKIRKLERKPIPHQAMGEFIIKDEPGKDKMNWRGYGHHVRISSRYSVIVYPLISACNIAASPSIFRKIWRSVYGLICRAASSITRDCRCQYRKAHSCNYAFGSKAS